MINRHQKTVRRGRFAALTLPAWLIAGSLLAGCGRPEALIHEEEVPAGATFNASKGVLLTDETRRLLGVELAEVSEQKLPAQIRFQVQVFGEKHHPAVRPDDHSGCDVQGSGVLPSGMTATLRAGQPVQLHARASGSFAGVVLAIEQARGLDDHEIIVGITNAAAKLTPGEFLSALISSPGTESVTVIPRAALLQAADGSFVYAANGEAFFRTAVKVGAESEDMVEITDGLLAGDVVVTKPVQTLWLIELRATKGGGGCTH
jgi:hypothetical protein